MQFKINLTLFRSQIAHKWDNIMKYIWRYLHNVISWEDVVKVASKLMFKIEIGAFCRQIVKNHFTHMWSITVYEAVSKAYMLCCYHHALTSGLSTELYALISTMKPWYNTMVFDYLSENDSHSAFEHQFSCHFHHILPRYHTW